MREFKFKVDDRVRHVEMGLGNIVKIEEGILPYLLRLDTGQEYWSVEETLTKEDTMDDEQKRFDAAMKAIDDGKACDDYKAFARGIVCGIFGKEEKPGEAWTRASKVEMSWNGAYFVLSVDGEEFVQRNACEIREIANIGECLLIPFSFDPNDGIRVRLAENKNPIFETKK